MQCDLAALRLKLQRRMKFRCRLNDRSISYRRLGSCRVRCAHLHYLSSERNGHKLIFSARRRKWRAHRRADDLPARGSLIPEDGGPIVGGRGGPGEGADVCCAVSFDCVYIVVDTPTRHRSTLSAGRLRYVIMTSNRISLCTRSQAFIRPPLKLTMSVQQSIDAVRVVSSAVDELCFTMTLWMPVCCIGRSASIF